ncbi:MAG: hypothetical protein JRE64_13365 [Deltaproteobacteria bacterium]|nr:hypothetical protein [Deltaproteobacteria bacterium]
MKQGGDALRKIVKDPGKFLDNLGAALKKGFNQFIDNFFKHLKAAFINWLFGTMSKAGIEIPSEFSFKGVFGLILQVIGITKDWIRSRVVKLIGAKNVERIEKAWSIVSTFISGGIGGLWEKAKEYLSDLKDKLFDTIQNWLITQIVKQAVIWVLSLLNPVSALLKIIKMIYDVVMFFVENIGRILQLVEAVIQSTAKIVAGNIGAAANWIESAMARILPIIISFLARLLGISGISNKISSFIKGIQKKVRKVVDKILKKIVKGIKKLLGKGKTAAKKVGKKIKELIFPKKTFSVGTEKHTVYVAKSGKKHKIFVKSKTLGVEDFIKHAQKEGAGNKAITKKTGELQTLYTKWKNMPEQNEKERKTKETRYVSIANKIKDIMKILPQSPVPPSVIHWDPLEKGRAKGVSADPLTYKGPSGSVPSETIKGHDTKLIYKGKKVAYIRAHLLHGKTSKPDLHGPGKKFNMTPTSSKINQLMYHGVEKHALAALGIKPENKVKKGRTVLNYNVKVSYSSSPPRDDLRNVAKRITMNVTQKDVVTGKESKVGQPFDEKNY